MSYCEEDGKDRIVFVTREDAEQPSSIVLAELPDDYNRGLILENGDINFNCPCLGGMASGPCGPEFRDAFSCFHYSQEEMKGSDCVEKFVNMQKCMNDYPTLYENENKAMEPPEEMIKNADEEAKHL